MTVACDMGAFGIMAVRVRGGGGTGGYRGGGVL